MVTLSKYLLKPFTSRRCRVFAVGRREAVSPGLVIALRWLLLVGSTPSSACAPRGSCPGGPASCLLQFSPAQLLSRVRLFATPWTAARQASLSITNSQSLLKLMSIESVTPSNHLILCSQLLLLPSIFPESGSFPNEVALHIR